MIADIHDAADDDNYDAADADNHDAANHNAELRC
jgi:hypothetical protein